MFASNGKKRLTETGFSVNLFLQQLSLKTEESTTESTENTEARCAQKKLKSFFLCALCALCGKKMGWQGLPRLGVFGGRV